MTPLMIVLMFLGVTASAELPSYPGQVADGRHAWIGPDGEILPFRDEDEVVEFLRAARVVAEQPISQGVNNSRKLLLEMDGVRLHAIFRTVETRASDERPDRRFRSEFRDNHTFECAAFELNRMLSIHRVPPVVERRYRGKRGSLQMWIEDSMDEQQRRRRGKHPPDPARWARQAEVRLVFDALIANQDRNLGNVIIDRDWKVWLIDHTRAFSPTRDLKDAKRIARCSQRLWDSLQTVDRDVVRERLGRYLTSRELESLFVRWDKLVAHIANLIEEQGERAVLVHASDR